MQKKAQKLAVKPLSRAGQLKELEQAAKQLYREVLDMEKRFNAYQREQDEKEEAEKLKKAKKKLASK